MIDLLLYTSLACSDASVIIQRVEDHEDVSNMIKKEIIATIKEATFECSWDAND